MKVLIKEQLSQHKYKDNHGYLICTDCIMARTGKQTYTRDECFGDGDCTEIEVDRKEKQVFDSRTLASFENVPITIEHPSCNVDSDNYNSLSVGHMRDIHRGTYQGKPVMMGTAVITDANAIEMVESGDLVNLSCGYDCDIIDGDHPEQTNIRGNHIALCQIPRAGITKIQDSLKNENIKSNGWKNFIKSVETETTYKVIPEYKDNFHSYILLEDENGNIVRADVKAYLDDDYELIFDSRTFTKDSIKALRRHRQSSQSKLYSSEYSFLFDLKNI